ncbi:hypothetical protein [Hymenobacter nivis]|uniref:Uncharacterized protein n=1 Tax=Hymenobacter nivis TaxID=1850093 RepID=A0A502GVV0_9BACT|nr:hypothetical protein [Hymenobacter nivis]TPG65528.1 hypothetical protein EAH73_13785 [Hymenobacter nivis]
MLTSAAGPALAQHAPGPPTAFPARHPLATQHYQLESLATGPAPPAMGPLPGQAARPAGAPAVAPAPALPPAPVPTVRAAARYAPLLPAPGPPPAAAPEPRRHLAAAPPGPPYDPYQHLPEEFRKRTLPAVWAAPLPLQLLRTALGH